MCNIVQHVGGAYLEGGGGAEVPLKLEGPHGARRERDQPSRDAQCGKRPQRQPRACEHERPSGRRLQVLRVSITVRIQFGFGFGCSIRSFDLDSI
eukprot:4816058-Pyramimonas_sp.AAC.1